MRSKLTVKQERFVQELIKGSSQRDAYKSAYDVIKNNNNNVDSNASRLFKNEKVKARYDELMAKLIKRTEEKAIITAEEIIKGISDIAKDDIGNYLEFKTVKQIVGEDDDGNPVLEYKTVINLNDSKGINTKNISEVSLSNGTFKFKTYARDTALYKLAEIFGLNKINKEKQKLLEDKFEHDKDIDSKRYW